jgi:hypothetical protein
MVFFKEHKKFLTKKNKEFIEKTILNNNFSYYLNNSSVEGDNCEYMSHVVLKRPEDKKEKDLEYNSFYYPQIIDIINSFFKKTKIEYKELLRIAVNLTYNNGHKKCEQHYDHKYDHKQLIIYLNNPLDKESKTVIIKNDKVYKEIYPEQYKGICFGKEKHYMHYPKFGNRVILVCTFK